MKEDVWAAGRPTAAAVACVLGIPASGGNYGLANDCTSEMIGGVKSEASPASGRRPDRFMTTRWSVVMSCADSGGDEEKAHAALAELCKIYWRPVFAFICRQGHSVPDAQDLTQDFPPNVRGFQDWPHTAVMAAWHRCTLALVPSICTDSCPTVVMEAMSTGQPVIASRIGGLIDIVADGETGLLVTPENAQELCTAMHRLLNNPDERSRMGHAAQQRVMAFQAKTVVSRIEQVYQDVLVG